MPSSSTNARLSTRGKRALLAVLTVGVLIVMYLGAEAAVRIRQHLKYGSVATIDDHYVVDPKSQLRVPLANLSSGRVRTNSLGFRGPEIALPKPSATVRLAFLGASTTWCAEVSSNEQVWTHVAAMSLGKAFQGARFDYVNAGVPGYTIGSMLKNFEARVAPLEPDVVVIYEAANNLSGELRQAALSAGVVDSAEMQEFSWPGRYSLLWNLVEKNLRVLNAQREARTATRPLKIAPAMLGEAYRHDLTQLVHAAQRHAKLVALATFSIQPRAQQPLEAQMQASASAFFYMPFVTPELLIAAYERYNHIIREVARDTGALLIEGEHDIPGDFQHFADTVHFTDAGSRAMAQRVTGALSSSAAFLDLAKNAERL